MDSPSLMPRKIQTPHGNKKRTCIKVGLIFIVITIIIIIIIIIIWTSFQTKVRVLYNKKRNGGVGLATLLKNNKSSYSDRIKNEMIKSSLNEQMPIYLKLFNAVLTSGTMPQTWCGWPYNTNF